MIARYGKTGEEVHGQQPGSVMTVEFTLNGQNFTALNGGPAFKFSRGLSLQVICETQQEIDYFWEKLGAGGDESAQMCGWLKDKYGLSWQIVPAVLPKLLSGNDPGKSANVMQAMLRMKKLEISKLEWAYGG